MLPADFDLDRVDGHLQVLVDEIGPRPWKGPAEAAAARYVAGQLEDAGWAPVAVERPANLVACRGDGRTLLMAHIDSAPGSPGAVDNAAAVGILLELARTTTALDLCVGFPDGEETGLHGSTALASDLGAWHPHPEALQLVVSTELLGQGEPAVMGLGPQWGQTRLAWLVEALDPMPQVPLPYRVYSRLYPRGERSDHGAFARRHDAPALLLFGRAEGGAFAGYHQPDDHTTDRDALRAAAEALGALATAAPPPPEPDEALPDASTVLGGRVLPSAATWLAVGAGAVSGALDLRRARELPAQLVRVLVATALCALVMVPFVTLGWFEPAPPEATAAATMGTPPTGWWAGAWPASAAGLVTLLGVRRLLGPRGSAPLAAALIGAAMLPLDPLLAGFFGVAAVAARVHPVLGALPALYVMQPEILREFAFHGLVPPAFWGLGWLLAWPALGRYPQADRSLHDPSRRDPAPKAGA